MNNPIESFNPNNIQNIPGGLDLSNIDLNAGGWKTAIKPKPKPDKSMKDWWLDYSGSVGEEVDKELALLLTGDQFHQYGKDLEDEYGVWNIFADYKEITNNYLYLQLKYKVDLERYGIKTDAFLVAKIRSPFDRPLMKDRYPMIDNVDYQWICRLKTMLIELSQGKTKEEILENWEKDKVEKPNF